MKSCSSARPTPSSTPVKSRSEVNINNTPSRAGQSSKTSPMHQEDKLPQIQYADNMLRDVLLNQIMLPLVDETSIETPKAKEQVFQGPFSEAGEDAPTDLSKTPTDKPQIPKPNPSSTEGIPAKAPKTVVEVEQPDQGSSDVPILSPFEAHPGAMQETKQSASDNSSTKTCYETKQNATFQKPENMPAEHVKGLLSDMEEYKEIRQGKRKKQKRKGHKNPENLNPASSTSNDLSGDGFHNASANNSSALDVFKKLIVMDPAVSNTTFTSADDTRPIKADGACHSSALTPESPSSSDKSRKLCSLGHSRNSSNSSQRSYDSVRKVDAKSTADKNKQAIEDRHSKSITIESPKASAKLDVGKSDATPKNLNDPADWPPLGPTKTSVSAGLDAKPPVVPALRARIERVASTKIVPAIPLSMERRRQS